MSRVNWKDMMAAMAAASDARPGWYLWMVLTLIAGSLFTLTVQFATGTNWGMLAWLPFLVIGPAPDPEQHGTADC